MGLARNWCTLLGTFLLALALTSCLATVQSGAFTVHKGSMEKAAEKVMGRAAFDLECPKDKLELVVLDVTSDLYNNNYPTQIGVTGCSHKATYVLVHDGWVMNTETGKDKQN